VHTEPELPLSAKSKGKQKAVDSVNGTAPVESVTPNKPGKVKAISQPPKLRALAPILPVDGEASISSGPVRGKKRNIAVASPTGSPAAPPSAKKKRKFQEFFVSEVAEIPNGLGHKSTGPDDMLLDPSQISARRKSLVGVDYLLLQFPRSNFFQRHPPAMIREPPTLSQLPSEVEPPQSQYNIRRVKLIVRPPPPLYSNPRQQPPRPRFHSSLSNFLNSYVSINDSDLREDDLNLMAQKKATLLDKMESFRQQGRLIVDNATFNEMSKTRGGVSLYESKQDRDTWDVVLEAITQRSRREQVKGRVIAAQISTRIKAYWDQRAQREDKAKMHEERRLRALAKATIKMVTSEWKKAVFVRIIFLFRGYCFNFNYPLHSTFGNSIDCARRLRKGAVVTNIWMLSSIGLAIYWKLNKQSLLGVICLAADRAVFLVTSWNLDSTLRVRKIQSLKWMREMRMVWSGNFRRRRATEIQRMPGMKKALRMKKKKTMMMIMMMRRRRAELVRRHYLGHHTLGLELMKLRAPPPKLVPIYWMPR
jgi:hypothetical protein